MKTCIFFISAITALFLSFILMSNVLRTFSENRINNKIKGLNALDALIQKSVDDDSVFNASLEGKVIVINLWASWCAPCVKEINDLNEIESTFRGKRIEFIALSNYSKKIDESFLKKHQMIFTYHRVYNRKKIYKYLQELDFKDQLESIPKHIVISSDGKIVLYLSGSSKENLEKIQSFLNRTI